MTAAILNLLLPQAATDGASSQTSAGAKGQVGIVGNESGAEGFSDLLSTARQQLSAQKQFNGNQQAAGSAAGVAVAALTTADLDALNAAALNLSDKQIADLQQIIGDALGSDIFAGDENAEQAFEQLQEQLSELDLSELSSDEVDVDAIIQELAVVSQLPENSRNDLLSRVRQFIQFSLIGGGAAAGAQAAKATNTTGTFSTEPLLEAVQASVFRDGQTTQAPIAQEAGQEGQKGQQTQATQTIQASGQAGQLTGAAHNAAAANAQSEGESLDVLAQGSADLPRWLRDISEISQAGNATKQTATAAYVSDNLPEVDLPDANVNSVNQSGRGDLQKLISAEQGQQQSSTKADIPNLSADAPTQKTDAVIAREQLMPLPSNNAEALRHVTTGQSALANVATSGGEVGVSFTAQQLTEAATYNAQAKTDPNLYQYRSEVLDQVEVAITRARTANTDRITVQLSPAELGRVEVSIDMRENGTAHLHVSAERRETLEMLQRDARGLERALQEAGVEADAGSMEFTLKQDGNQHASLEGEHGGNGGSGAHEHGDAKQPDAAHAENQTNSEQTEIITTTAHVIQHGLNVVI